MESPVSVPSVGVIRFGVYEANPETGELRKAGVRIRLADQPFQVLIALLDRPGSLVTREELRKLLWADAEAGGFEQGVTRAVNKLRVALSDSASNPRFIETLPGHGYRFVGDVERPSKDVSTETNPSSSHNRTSRTPWLLGIVLAVVAGMALSVWTLIPGRFPDVRWRRLTTDNFNKTAPALSDGSRLYFLANYDGETFLAQIPIRGGQPSRLPITLPGPVCNLQDISPDGQDLLLLAGPSIDRSRMLPLWTLQIADGTARRVAGVLATSASYASTDGAIAYTAEGELWLITANGGRRKLVELRDSVLNSVSWDPSGRLIRFSRQSVSSSQSSAWQIARDGSTMTEVLPQWRSLSHVPAGWTADGHFEAFSAAGSFFFRQVNGWKRWSPDATPTRTTDGELEFSDRVRIRGNSSFAAIGVDRLGELQKFDLQTREWRPLLDGISAEKVEFSRDGARVLYVSYPQRTLWVRDADGKRPIQITSSPMTVTFARWSPDGKRIAFAGQEQPGKQTRIYLVDAEGGSVRQAAPVDPGSQDDPAWSDDGKQLLYGLNARSTREPVYIRVVNLETGIVSKLPGSDDLFSPRWSPNGEMVAALEWQPTHRLMLYRFHQDKWSKLTAERADWPTWTADSQRILFRGAGHLVETQVSDGRERQVAPIKTEEFGGYSRWVGRTSDGSPTRTLNRDGRQVYELLLQ